MLSLKLVNNYCLKAVAFYIHHATLKWYVRKQDFHNFLKINRLICFKYNPVTDNNKEELARLFPEKVQFLGERKSSHSLEFFIEKTEKKIF